MCIRDSYKYTYNNGHLAMADPLAAARNFLNAMERIPSIIDQYKAKNEELECSVSGFSSEARKALLKHAWPGNVRALRQKVMGAVLQAQEGVVMKEHLNLP